MRGRIRHVILLGIIALLWAFVAPIAPTSYATQGGPSAAVGDWTTYMYSTARHGFNAAETVINANTVANLKLKWIHTTSGSIFSQPVVSNGIIYWGSDDGYEHATDLNNGKVWANFLGTTQSTCNGNTTGVISTATVAPVTIGGTTTSVDFVGGGDAHMYALNAATGAVIWSISLGSSPSHFLWSSPLVYQGKVYEGVASLDDCPLVQGQLVQLDAATGNILHTFNIVPNGCVGGGLWGSPTLDQTDNSIYFATGNPGSCSKSEPYTIALVKVRASDLSYVSSWQIPSSEQVSDGDFGTTPTLFKANIGGTTHQMVGAGNKNGIYYAFDRTSISKGPLWRAKIACPDCPSRGILAPAAWDGTTLFVGTRNTTINGTSCQGGLFALNPATGSSLWQHCLRDGPVFGAVSLVTGVAIVDDGPYFLAISTSGGQTLFRYLASGTGETFIGSASISHGVLYFGSTTGNLYAFAP